MTSALGGVLSVALVLSTIGTASEGSADHDINSEMTLHIDHRYLYKPYVYLNMKSRTNIQRYSKYDDFMNTSQKSTKNINYKDNLIVNRSIGRNGGITGGVRRVKRSSTEDCEYFNYDPKKPNNLIEHPHAKHNKTYSPNMNCPLVIQVGDSLGITLTFVDFFHIEDHPNCEYDFLEIREGPHGYGHLIGKYCGEKFPPVVMSTGPALWLKFKSDDTIEYEGFHISVNIQEKSNSHAVPKSCNTNVTGEDGLIDTEEIDSKCLDDSAGGNLDVLWSIVAPENYTIYLNFTDFNLAETNNCEANLVQVFGYVLEFDSKLAHYCGTIANPVMTTSTEKDGKKEYPTNIMYVRMFAAKTARSKSKFKARFTALRTTKGTSACNETTEFDCGDNTCIKKDLKCNGYANCRLKTDEDPENCPDDPEMLIGKPHIMAILVIFSLILSGMSFVFLFKCIRKLYLDHKIIKEHIRQSCEDRLDTLIDSRFTLDPKKLQRDSVRASLERDNHTNEMVKQQRKLSQQQKHSSIDSDIIQETHIGFEPWTREVETTPLEAASIKLERNGRTRRHDTSKREESLRRKRDRGSTEPRERKEIRDASVSAPDTMESGCQTRESLFQAEIAPSEGSGNSSNSRGFSTFGYSGGTVVRPSPPALIETAEITIELLSQVTPQESVKPQKKISDRRPMSTETTRSAPDVIIVSKPIH